MHWLKVDWYYEAFYKAVTKVPFAVWVKESQSDKQSVEQKDDEPSDGGKKEKDRDQRDQGHGGDEGKPETIVFEGSEVTLEQYLKVRPFKFLHHYAGADDPLTKAILAEAELWELRVAVTTCEKKSGVDLLHEQPYNHHCKLAEEGHWDGYHSGFPCTTFSRLRHRVDPEYPGPVRSKEFPYGLPDNTKRRQDECDTGTLHASRSAFLAGKIMHGRKGDKIKPAVTMENPPPSNLEDHLSAWELKEVETVTKEHDFIEATFPTCAYQMNVTKGERFFKPQMFKGTLLGLTSMSDICPCEGKGHQSIVGKALSERSGKYPPMLCKRYAGLLLNHFIKMGTMEFYSIREKSVKKKVEDLRTRSDNKRKADAPEEPTVQKKPKAPPGVNLISPPSTSSETTGTATTSEKEETVPASSSRDKPRGVSPPPKTAVSPVTPPAKKRAPSAEPPRAPTKQPRTLDWAGGEGDYEMLRSSKAKSKNPSNQRYVGGMRNPADAAQGNPQSMALGMRVFAAWERFTKSHPEVTETAAQYGTKDCSMPERSIEAWRGELRKILASRGKQAVALKSKWEFTTPFDFGSVRSLDQKIR